MPLLALAITFEPPPFGLLYFSGFPFIVYFMAEKKRTYSVEILKEEDGKSYYAVVPSLPGCFSQGKTIEQAKKNVAKAIKLHLRCMKKAGTPLPEVESYQTTIQIAA